jgi:hypothetical protein
LHYSNIIFDYDFLRPKIEEVEKRIAVLKDQSEKKKTKQENDLEKDLEKDLQKKINEAEEEVNKPKTQ